MLNPEARVVLLLALALAQDSDSGAGGTGEVGDPCTDAADCSIDLICLVDGTLSYCTTPCTAEADCPEGFACFATGDDAVCAVDASAGGGECGCSPEAGGAGASWALTAASFLVRRRR